MAQGGLYTLPRCGISIPKDVELLSLGMQETETMQYLTPSISCVSVPPNVDKQAMMILIQPMQQGSSEPIHVELSPWCSCGRVLPCPKILDFHKMKA